MTLSTLTPAELRRYTALGMVIALAVILIYDAFAAWIGEEATITVITRDISGPNWIIPVFGGILCGHLWAQQWYWFAIGFGIGGVAANPWGRATLMKWLRRK